MPRISRFSKISFILLLVFWPFTYSYHVQSEGFQSISEPPKTIELKEIIKGKSFFEKISSSEYGAEFRVFVKAPDKTTYNVLRRIGKNVQTFNSYSGMVLSISKSLLYDLIFDEKILGVWENSVICSTADDYRQSSLNYTQEIANFTKMVSADYMWDLNFYGSGTKVAILDTGIKTDHLALNVSMDNMSRITDTWNFIDNNANAEDDNGHGTNVAGIIGSNGLFGYNKGIAPNCSFMIGKVLDYNGLGTTELLIQGIDWAISNGADVINLSLGTLVADKNSPEIEAVDNAVGNGTLVCAAAGNMRSRPEFGYSDLYTILTPGIARKAITVGAVDSNKILYEHSSAGPVAVNYQSQSANYIFDSVDLTNTWLKPDLVAPGVKINTTSFETQNTTVVSGTSYATAVVAGVCLLLREQSPSKKESVIKAALLSSSSDISPEIMSPLNNTVSVTISPRYQGAGLVNTTGAKEFLENPPSITIWPNKVPFTKEVYNNNEFSSFYVSVFVNGPINTLTIQYYEALKPLMYFSGIPRYPSVDQYDVLMDLATTEGSDGWNNFLVRFSDGLFGADMTVSLYNAKGKGRILYDCNEIGGDNFYSMHGSLYDLLDISRYFGFIPTILPKDGTPIHLSDVNLNHFEAIALINYNNSNILDYSINDKDSILNYLLNNELYKGKTAIILPSRNSDLIGLNSILEAVNITHDVLLASTEILEVSSFNHTFLTGYHSLNLLFVPLPLEVVKENDPSNTILDRFVFSDSRIDNGSLVVASNNVEMFLSSPYIYNGLTSNYEEKLNSLHFGDNYKFFENILSSSAIYEPTINYSVSTTEMKMSEEVFVTVQVANNFGPMLNWDLFLTLNSVPNMPQSIDIRYYDIIDYENGTYAFRFSPQEYNIPSGNYLLSIRSPCETMTWNLYLITNYSWGPILVIIPIAVCTLIFAYLRLRKTKKLRR